MRSRISRHEAAEKYGNGLEQRIFRRIIIGTPESYPEYGAEFFGGEAAKGRQFKPVQLFFRNLQEVRGCCFTNAALLRSVAEGPNESDEARAGRSVAGLSL